MVSRAFAACYGSREKTQHLQLDQTVAGISRHSLKSPLLPSCNAGAESAFSVINLSARCTALCNQDEGAERVSNELRQSTQPLSCSTRCTIHVILWPLPLLPRVSFPTTFPVPVGGGGRIFLPQKFRSDMGKASPRSSLLPFHGRWTSLGWMSPCI